MNTNPTAPDLADAFRSRSREFLRHAAALERAGENGGACYARRRAAEALRFAAKFSTLDRGKLRFASIHKES